MRKMTKIEKEVAREIGTFYMDKEYLKDTSKDPLIVASEAGQTISELGISELEVEDLQITIKLTKPGFLIGCKGQNITELEEYLLKKLKKEYKISIREDELQDYLFSIIKGTFLAFEGEFDFDGIEDFAEEGIIDID